MTKTLGTTNRSWQQLADLHAARHGTGLPVPMIQHGAFGGWTENRLVKSTGTPSLRDLQLLSNPNISASNNQLNYLRPADAAAVQSARLERLNAMQQQADQLPRLREAVAQYVDTLNSESLLSTMPRVRSLDGFADIHAGLLAVQGGLTSSLQFVVGS